MARVNVSVPDEVIARAHDAGVNVSRVATSALEHELERLARVALLDAYLADLDERHGPVPDADLDAARSWLDAAG
ncbi:MAG: type II toxin-antitoxin system CcdA family antitoxin [Dermatophilaceae bacterium]